MEDQNSKSQDYPRLIHTQSQNNWLLVTEEEAQEIIEDYVMDRTECISRRNLEVYIWKGFERMGILVRMRGKWCYTVLIPGRLQ